MDDAIHFPTAATNMYPFIILAFRSITLLPHDMVTRNVIIPTVRGMAGYSTQGYNVPIANCVAGKCSLESISLIGRAI